MTSISAILFLLCFSSMKENFHVSSEVTPQDDIDAQAIVDSLLNEEVIAGIMACREKPRRLSIRDRIWEKNSHTLVPVSTLTYYDGKYKPQDTANSLFKDLFFALCYEENHVMARYLGNFMDHKDETWIIITMVLTEDITSMISTFEYMNGESIRTKRHKQRKPFQFMFRAWCRQNREQDEQGDPDTTTVTNDVNILKEEKSSSCWTKYRNQIEHITMEKSAKYAKTVIQKYAELHGSLDSAILGCVETNQLNHDLAGAYVALVRYLKDKHNYIATILHQYSDGVDRFAAWLMCINVVDSKEWPQIDKAFKANYKESLSSFIVKKASKDPLFAETIAVVVDPSFKPTKFTKKPIQGELANSGSPPAVPPTTSA